MQTQWSTFYQTKPTRIIAATIISSAKTQNNEFNVKPLYGDTLFGKSIICDRVINPGFQYNETDLITEKHLLKAFRAGQDLGYALHEMRWLIAWRKFILKLRMKFVKNKFSKVKKTF